MNNARAKARARALEDIKRLESYHSVETQPVGSYDTAQPYAPHKYSGSLSNELDDKHEVVDTVEDVEIEDAQSVKTTVSYIEDTSEDNTSKRFKLPDVSYEKLSVVALGIKEWLDKPSLYGYKRLHLVTFALSVFVMVVLVYTVTSSLINGSEISSSSKL